MANTDNWHSAISLRFRALRVLVVALPTLGFCRATGANQAAAGVPGMICIGESACNAVTLAASMCMI